MEGSDQSSRPWWAKKRWVAASLLWLLVAYPISAGPSLWLARHGYLPPPCGLAYVPIESLCFPDPQPGFGWLRNYAEWFASL